MDTLHAVHFQRKPHFSDFSFERVFALVREHMPPDILCTPAVAARRSRGFWPRVVNCVWAAGRQKDINHVTGDIHYIAIFLRTRKTILTVHDMSSLQRLRGLRRFVYLLFWFYLPVWRAGRVTVISESSRRELIKHVPWARKKTTVVHDPCSPDFSYRPREFRTKSPRILFIGTRPNKNLTRVVAALRDIPCVLDIVGRLTDGQRAMLAASGITYEQSADLSDRQMVEKFTACDMLVFVSLYEGFGLPILEAQATGRPVVTADIFSMPETAGEGACLVDPYSVPAIRRGIKCIILDRKYREQLVTNGLENVKRYHPSIVAGQYVSVYRELV